MTTSLDQIMEDASHKLAEMNYLASESLCLQALAEARVQGRWNYYARIVLPLQECRRQRRMIAAESTVVIGTPGDVPRLSAGCLLVSKPHRQEDAAVVAREAAQAGLHVEVLYASQTPDEGPWTIETFVGPSAHCEVAAPLNVEKGQPIDAIEQPFAAHWFIAASEALGDAALEQVTAPLGSLERVEQIEARIAAVSDHEILHQRLAEAARAVALEAGAGAS